MTYEEEVRSLPGLVLAALSGVSGPWYCVKCGIERPTDPSKVCPRPGCGMRAYGSRRPDKPVLPP